jgi:hypothetical protein
MSKTLEQLLGSVPKQSREPRTCEVDLTDLLGDGWVMQYREPSVADLFAASDTRTLAEWERVMPDIPRDLATTLELIARLHISPPAAELASSTLSCCSGCPHKPRLRCLGALGTR